MKTAWPRLLALIVCLSLVLAACGGSGKQSESASGENRQESQSGGETSGGQSSGDGQSSEGGNDKSFTIRVGAWFIDDRPYQQKFKSDIEEAYKKLYPNAKIQWEITLGAAYFDKLKAQFASKSAPDVVFYQGHDFAKSGNLLDLSNEPWIAGLTGMGQQDVQTHFEGKTYAVPMGIMFPAGVWYNKDLFEKNGWKPPANVQEFMELCEAIKNAGITPIALGFKDTWTASMFLETWIQSYAFHDDHDFGKKIYSGEKKLDDPAIQAVFKNLELMKKNGYFNKNALSIDWPQSAQLFASGEAAMIMQGPWMPGANADNIEKGGFEKFRIGYFPLMNEQGNYSFALESNEALAINADTELVQEAKDLVQVILRPEIYGPFNAGDGSIPAIEGITAEYADTVYNDVMEYVSKAYQTPYRLGHFVPASAMSSLTDLTTAVVSGVSFKAENLQAALQAFEKDKATVTPPVQ